MSSRPRSHSHKSLSTSGSGDTSHDTSGDDDATYPPQQRRFTKQRSVSDMFNRFVGNGARHFRNLVTRVNRQRRHTSSPNIARESWNASADLLAEGHGLQSKHHNEQDDQTHLERTSRNTNHTDNTLVAQGRVDKTCTPQTQVDNTCKAQCYALKAFTTQTRTDKSSTAQTELYKQCTDQTQVRAENEAVLRLLVNRETQMKRTLLPRAATLSRCEPGATQGEQVHFPVIDGGNRVNPRQQSRRASLTVMPSVEDNIYLYGQDEQTGSRCTGHAPHHESSDSLKPASIERSGQSVSPDSNTFRINSRDPCSSGINTNKTALSFNDTLAKSSHIYAPSCANRNNGDQLQTVTDQCTNTFRDGHRVNQDSDNQLEMSTKYEASHAGGFSSNEDSDDQKQISTEKTAVLHHSEFSQNEDSDKRQEIFTDINAVPCAGLIEVDSDNRLQTQSDVKTNCNQLDEALSHQGKYDENVNEYHSTDIMVKRKTVGHAFGTYVDKQAGRFRALVLRMNIRTRRRDNTNSVLISSDKQTTSSQRKATQNESNTSTHHAKNKRKVSRSYHHSDCMLYSDAADHSDEESCDDDVGAVDAVAGTSNESQALVEDLKELSSTLHLTKSTPLVEELKVSTPTFYPTNTESIHFNTEQEKKKLQELKNDNGSVSNKTCYECVQENKGIQKLRCNDFEKKNENFTPAGVVNDVKYTSKYSILRQSSSPYWSSQTGSRGGKPEQSTCVLESDVRTVKPGGIISKNNIIIRSFSLNPDTHSRFVNVSDGPGPHRQIDMDCVGQVTEKYVENDAKIKRQHSRKQFHKQSSLDRLATFMSKRSGNFRKLFTKANRNDSVCEDINNDIGFEAPTLALEANRSQNVRKDISSDMCTLDTEVCANKSKSNHTFSNPSYQTSCTQQGFQENIELNSFRNKRVHNGNYVVALKNDYESPKTEGCTMVKKDEVKDNEHLTVSCSEILLEIKSDDHTENKHTTKPNELQITESIPAHLNVANEADGKNTIEKSKRCSPTCLRSNFVEHPDFSQILTFLTLCSIETASNGHLLCKFGIDSLIDISSASFEALNQQRVCYPCLCSKRNHFRSRLNINIEDIEWENIEEHFKDINSFIEGARLSGKSVLVYSYHGNSRAAAIIVQYLMRHFRMSLTAAYNLVSARRPSVCVNPGFQKALKRLEAKLLIEWKTNVSSCEMDIGKYLLKPATRQAWTKSLGLDD